jgi:hypothetical protein
MRNVLINTLLRALNRSKPLAAYKAFTRPHGFALLAVASQYFPCFPVRFWRPLQMGEKSSKINAFGEPLTV